MPRPLPSRERVVGFQGLQREPQIAFLIGAPIRIGEIQNFAEGAVFDWALERCRPIRLVRNLKDSGVWQLGLRDCRFPSLYPRVGRLHGWTWLVARGRLLVRDWRGALRHFDTRCWPAARHRSVHRSRPGALRLHSLGRARQDVQHRALEGAVRLTDRTLTELATSAAAEADDFLSAALGPAGSVLDGHRLGQHIVRGGLHGSAITGGLDLDDQARVQVKIAVHLQPAALHHALEARLAAGRDLLELAAALHQNPAAGDVGLRVATVARHDDAAFGIGEINLERRLDEAVEKLIPD